MTELEQCVLSVASGSGLTVAPGRSEKKKRRSYTKEEKMKVIAFYKEHNLYKTCQKFHVNSKNVLRWKKDEDKIAASKRGSR